MLKYTETKRERRAVFPIIMPGMVHHLLKAHLYNFRMTSEKRQNYERGAKMKIQYKYLNLKP